MSRYNYKREELKKDESFRQHLIRMNILSSRMKKYLDEYPPTTFFKKNFPEI